MADRVRGGWEGEKQVRFFDGANSFEEIINLFTNPALAHLRELHPAMAIQAQTEFTNNHIVSARTIMAMPEDYGFRDAILRAIAPNFTQDHSLEVILKRLEFTVEQNRQLVGLQDARGQQWSVFKTSSGAAIKIETYIEALQNIRAFLNNPNQKNHTDAYDMVQNLGLTSSGGFRDAVSRSVINFLARANEKTGPIPKS